MVTLLFLFKLKVFDLKVSFSDIRQETIVISANMFRNEAMSVVYNIQKRL